MAASGTAPTLGNPSGDESGSAAVPLLNRLTMPSRRFTTAVPRVGARTGGAGDLIAVILAAASLFLPWDTVQAGLANPAVLGAVLATTAAAVLPWVAGSRRSDSAVPASVLSVVKAVLVTPLLVLAGTVLAQGALGTAGVGPGAILAVSAAVIAGQRQAPSSRPGSDAGSGSIPARWLSASLTGLAAVWLAVDLLGVLLPRWTESGLWAASMPWLAVCVSVCYLAIGLARDRPHLTAVLTLYWAIWLAVIVVQGLAWTNGWEDFVTVTGSGTPGHLDPRLGGMLVFLGAAAAARVPTYRRSRATAGGRPAEDSTADVAPSPMAPTGHPPTGHLWIDVTVAFLTLNVILLAGQTLRMVLILTADTVGLAVDIPLIASLLLVYAGGLSACLWCHWLLRHHPAVGRGIAAGTMLVLVAGGVAVIARTQLVIRPEALVLLLSAGSVIAALLIPRSLRAELGPLRPRRGMLSLRAAVPEYAGAPEGAWEAPTWPTPEELFDDPPQPDLSTDPVSSAPSGV